VQLFEIPLDPSESRTVQTAESIAIEEKEKREETHEIGFALKKIDDLDSAKLVRATNERYELVEQYEWEEDIMWGVDDAAQSMEIEDTEL
jgi:hypothetical protein